MSSNKAHWTAVREASVRCANRMCIKLHKFYSDIFGEIPLLIKKKDGILRGKTS